MTNRAKQIQYPKTNNIKLHKYKEIPSGSPFFCALMNGLDNLYSSREDLLRLYPLIRTIRLFKHLLQVGFVFSRCALAAIHGVDQIKVPFSVQMAFDFQIVKLLLQVLVVAAQKTIVEQHDRAERKATARWNVVNLYIGFKHIRHLTPPFTREEYGEA